MKKSSLCRATKISKYLALWKKIRDNPNTTIKIYAPIEQHKTIIKALRNKKCADRILKEKKSYTILTCERYPVATPPYIAATLREVLPINLSEQIHKF